MLLIINGFQNIELLHNGNLFNIYKAIRSSDNQKVILKICSNDLPTLKEIMNLKQEYKYLQETDSKYVIKALDLIKHHQQIALVLENIEAISLKNYLKDNSLSIENFFMIALQVINGLGDLHANKIIHKDINPDNIIIVPTTLQVKIIDLGLATRLNIEIEAVIPELLEGTLPYISPEATGRMNAIVDYRSDYYSLGVMFYEMLAGRLPFEQQEILELIYSHLAKTAIPINQRNSKVPPILSEIVAKLMEKQPEERYQSENGIRADLLACQTQWLASGNIIDFQLGREDFTDKLVISQKLYGREPQVAGLLEVFERINKPDAHCEIYLVTGPAGIGKSSLIKEIYKPITRQRGFFISGKYDQMQHSTPFSAIIEAFQNLLNRLLAESPVLLDKLRISLLKALGNNGQAIIAILPKLSLIIGEQPLLEVLPLEQANQRFAITFQSFVRVFAQPEHPLVLFLDDLQWADSASFDLVEKILSDSALRHCLIIGAYRDNEVTIDHPLSITLQGLKKYNVVINNVPLEPLRLTDIIHLLADTFKLDENQVEALAQIILNKTEGNAFFINEFIKMLYQNKFIKFSFQEKSWVWDSQFINQQTVTSNVIELLLDRIRMLPLETQEILSLAASIDHTFDIETLAIISNRSPLSIVQLLLTAVEAHFIKPLGDYFQHIAVAENPEAQFNIHYQFMHDRIQQSIYLLIPQDQRQITHLRIGRLLLQAKESSTERVFAILTHMNQCLDLLIDPQERLQIAELNSIAADKAQASMAYEASHAYAQAGLTLLPDQPFKTHSELAIRLYKSLATNEYLLRNSVKALELLSVLAKEVKDLPEQVAVCNLRIFILLSMDKAKESLLLGLSFLKNHGMNISASTKIWNLILEMLAVEWKLKFQDVAQLQLAPMENKNFFLLTELLVHLHTVAYSLGDQKLSLFITFRLTNLYLAYGYTPSTPMVLTCVAMFNLGGPQNYKKGMAYAELSKNIREKCPMANNILKERGLYYASIERFKHTIKETEPKMLNLYIQALQRGELITAIYSLYSHAQSIFIFGLPLIEFQKSLDNILAFKKSYNADINDASYLANLQVIQVMTEEVRLENRTPISRELLNNSELAIVTSREAILFYLTEDYESARELCDKSVDIVKIFRALYHFPFHKLIHALSLTFCATVADPETRASYIKKLKPLMKLFKRWASWYPPNYLSYYLLVKAELARLNADRISAEDLYDEAIKAANESEHLCLMGIANECAMRFYIQHQKFHIAKLYFKSSLYAYEKWGGLLKLRLLKEAYPEWTEDLLSSSSHNIRSTFSSDAGNALKSLDLQSILKSAQVISKEIELDKLLQKLLSILLENAAAEKGMLLMKEAQGWFVRAEGTVAEQIITLTQTENTEKRTDLPLSLIQYVQRSKEQVLLQNPEEFEKYYTDDPYLENIKPKSVLILPVQYQNELVSIFYFENRVISRAFNEGNIQTLNLLASQAAISLENAKLYYQATHDNLTGLANRNLLHYLFSRAAIKAKRDNKLIAILFFDLDGFKKINDTLGHEAGDKLLLHFTSLLNKCLRGSDLAARLGGDEFIVMLENLDDPNQASLFATRLLQLLNEPLIIDKNNILIAASIGISLYPHNGDDIQHLLKQADDALYIVKNSGKNNYKFAL